jgi:squalene synthase HpnC
MRPHVAVVYAFARAADDFADEGQRPADERHRLLDGWLRRLRHAAKGLKTRERPPERGEPPETVDLFMELGVTIRELSLPVSLFEDLLSAFRQDVTVARYDTWDQLLDYCRRSANPVGRIVLRIAGYDDEQLDRWSDSICTGLQLVNFWQDLKMDFDRGRLYVPAEVLQRYGATEAELSAGNMTPAWRSVLEDVASRTRLLFRDGRPLCEQLEGRLRYELRATWLGGIRILNRLEKRRFDVVKSRPVIGAGDLPWFVARMVAWPLGAGASRSR